MRCADGRPSAQSVGPKSLGWWTSDRRTIAIRVAVDDGTNGGVEASRHLLHFLFCDKAGARTGKDTAVLLFVHLAPFLQTECLPLTKTRACLSLTPPETGQRSRVVFLSRARSGGTECAPAPLRTPTTETRRKERTTITGPQMNADPRQVGTGEREN